MRWTTEAPSTEGWYYRKGLDGNVEIVEIRKKNGKLKIFINLAVTYPIPSESLWAGPIPKPKGDKK